MTNPGFSSAAWIFNQATIGELYNWRIAIPQRGNASPERIVLNGPENGSAATSSNLDHLLSNLEALEPGHYIVTLEKPQEKNDRNTFTPAAIKMSYVRKPDSANQPSIGSSGFGGVGVGMYSELQLREIIAKEQELWKKDLELSDLRRDIDELKANPPSTSIDRFIEGIMPYVGQLVPGFAEKMGMIPAGGAAVARVGVSGFGDKDALQTEQDSTQAFADALEHWQQAEPDLLTVITRLSNLAHDNPTLYATGKKALSL